MTAMLTREEALAKHREMWSAMQKELGDKPNLVSRVAFKSGWCAKHDGPGQITNSCYLCEYTKGRCEECPIEWPDGGCTEGKVNYASSLISEILALPEKGMKKEGTMPKTVEFTEEEIKTLAIYLDLSLIPYIANKDNEVDNLDWVRVMTCIWYKCTEAMKKEKD